MVLTANLIELDAVNEMLHSIGEAPVSTLTSGLADAAQALTALRGTSRAVQLEGWNANTRRGVSLPRDASNIIGVPVDTLRVETTNARSHRKETRPVLSGHVNVSVRKSIDGTKFLLYDNDNDRETWANDATLTVNIIQLLEFDDLPPSLQIYIARLAARRWQKGAMASKVLWEFTSEEVIEAYVMAAQDDEQTDNSNIIKDSGHVFDIVKRNSPFFGR